VHLSRENGAYKLGWWWLLLLLLWLYYNGVLTDATHGGCTPEVVTPPAFPKLFLLLFFFLSLDRFSPISFSLPLERNDYNVLCFLFIIHFKLQKPHEALVTC
jgi:hypothetical protein